MRTSKFVESYFDAWNHHDPEGVADHLTEDGIFCDVPENARRGIERRLRKARPSRPSVVRPLRTSVSIPRSPQPNRAG